MITIFLTYLIFHLKLTTRIYRSFGTQNKRLLFLSSLRYIKIQINCNNIFFHILQGYISFNEFKGLDSE